MTAYGLRSSTAVNRLPLHATLISRRKLYGLQMHIDRLVDVMTIAIATGMPRACAMS